MTLTIHRQGWLQRLAISLGLAAILASRICAIQNTSTEPAAAPAADLPAVIAATESAGYWETLQSLQDNHLPPTMASQPAGYWQTLQSLQDNHLPPTATSRTELDPTGSSDNRTNEPR